MKLSRSRIARSAETRRKPVKCASVASRIPKSSGVESASDAGRDLSTSIRRRQARTKSPSCPHSTGRAVVVTTHDHIGDGMTFIDTAGSVVNPIVEVMIGGGDKPTKTITKAHGQVIVDRLVDRGD